MKEKEKLKGYVILPKSIMEDPCYKNTRLKYKHVLHMILLHVNTKDGMYNKELFLTRGQLYITLKNLIEICNEGHHYTEDRIRKDIMTRAIKHWVKFGIIKHDVIDNRSLITIYHKDIYESMDKLKQY